MADFNIAFRKTMEYEGGYSDHPKDPGGETYMGIARNKHPQWVGWEKIDQYIGSSEFPKVLENDRALKGQVQEFYEHVFWLAICGDIIKSQDIANHLFDIAVNMGVRRAVVFLQIALNVLNREGTLYPNIEVDGYAGPQTQQVLHVHQDYEPPGYLIKLLVIQRGAYYIDIVLRREESETFIRGWLRRWGLR